MEEKVIYTSETKEETTNETMVMAEAPEPLIGVVFGCKKLNIRKRPVVNPNNVLCVVEMNTELEIIEPEKATGQWYKVVTSDGVKGFCMKEFVNVE